MLSGLLELFQHATVKTHFVITDLEQSIQLEVYKFKRIISHTKSAIFAWL